MTAPTFPVPCVNPKPPTMGTWRPAADHECVAPEAADHDHGYMVPTAIIGVDFDNTLIIYDDLLKKLALDRDLLGDRAIEGKRQIRDALRRAERRNRVAETASRRLRSLHRRGPPGRRRRPFPPACPGSRNHGLYDQSQDRMGQSGPHRHKLAPGGVGLDGGQRAVRRFRGTEPRQGLLRRNARGENRPYPRSRCTHFIDDLEETFAETSFPAGVARILYAPHPTPTPPPGVMVVQSWKQICEYFFADNC